MNSKQSIILVIFSVLSVLGEANDSNAEPITLDEIAVTGSSIPELDLFRSSILTKDQVNDRQIDNLVDLSGLSP